jgi:hypothetical protein
VFEDERGERSMAKMKKRPAKKHTAKTKTKKSAKKPVRKPAKKQSVAKKATPAKKAVGVPVPSKPAVAKRLVLTRNSGRRRRRALRR